MKKFTSSYCDQISTYSWLMYSTKLCNGTTPRIGENHEQPTKLKLLATAIACACAMPVMAMDLYDPDHIRRAETEKVSEEQKEGQDKPVFNGVIPNGANPFDYLPAEKIHNIFEKASDEDLQTAQNLTSVDQYSNDVMEMDGENSLANQARTAKNAIIIIKKMPRPGEPICVNFNSEEINKNTINDRVLAIVCKELPSALMCNLDGCTHISDISPLRDIPVLVFGVNLNGCEKIQDLSPLEKAVELRRLNVMGCVKIQEEQIHELSLKLPNCEIYSDFGLYINGVRHLIIFGWTMF